jgi:hypothetical protein
MPTDGDAKCFGFVTSYDTKPKRRQAELLKAQGLQMNQAITFLSDGGDNVRDLQLYLSPLAEHLLDWFHITALRQQLKELIAAVPDHELEKLDDDLERVKWYLWHGNVFGHSRCLRGSSGSWKIWTRRCRQAANSPKRGRVPRLHQDEREFHSEL